MTPAELFTVGDEVTCTKDLEGRWLVSYTVPDTAGRIRIHKPSSGISALVPPELLTLRRR